MYKHGCLSGGRGGGGGRFITATTGHRRIHIYYFNLAFLNIDFYLFILNECSQL